MNSKKTALSFAAAGTVAGVAGLVFLAAPAGAGEAPPALPAVSADKLVESVLTAKVPALGGAVELENNLGLPIPGLPGAMGGGGDIRVYTDGQGRGHISLPGRNGETTVVDDGATVWVWNSDDKTVLKVPEGKGEHKTPLEGKFADPAAAARELVNAMQQDSTVEVDGTARVADRPVYQLVLAPKPTERTLLREIRVSVDSQTRVPLQLEVLANGQADPALKVGFTEFSTGQQDPSLFKFTPPEGAKVTEHKPDKELAGKSPEKLLSQLDLKTVGRGWDTVLTGTLPKDALSMPGEKGQATAMQLLGSIGKEVHGTFGTGWIITTKVGTALITDDGRVALGAVPEQVVIRALSK